MTETIDNFWKIKRDNFYYPLYLKYGLDYIKKAGFFFDENAHNVDLEESLKILCTPLCHIMNSFKNEKKSIILISSGALCPIHDGHIEMIRLAKVQMESLGFNVLGGYISPDHDRYVSRKNTHESISSIERVQLTSEKIWEHDFGSWLAVDPWYALFNNCDVNFTDLCARTKLYIEKYIKSEVSICYVCGSDNGDFSLAFENQKDYYAVVVNRPNHTESYKTELSNVFVLDSTVNLSSTMMRKSHEYKTLNKKSLKLRRDDTPAIPLDIFNKYFDNIELIDYNEQLKKFNKLRGNVISLDPLIRGKNYIQTSRIYDVFGHQKHGQFIANDYCLDTNKKYHLYDDDIYTGETMRRVSQDLKENDIEIESFISFNNSDSKTHEVLDNRDFIIFSEHDEKNGLVSGINHIRLPYVYPFVDPLLRCSITSPLEFSIDIWQFNLEINKDSGMVLYDSNQFELFSMLGFDGDMPVMDICSYYINFLTNL